MQIKTKNDYRYLLFITDLFECSWYVSNNLINAYKKVRSPINVGR